MEDRRYLELEFHEGDWFLVFYNGDELLLKLPYDLFQEIFDANLMHKGERTEGEYWFYNLETW